MYYVPELLEGIGVVSGTDLVARIGQQGTHGYGIIRVTIDGPLGQFNMYRGNISTQSKFTSVLSPGVTDAQFTPPENIRSGSDVIGVWIGGATYVGTARMTLTTDGGL